jgi:rhamnulokinase
MNAATYLAIDLGAESGRAMLGKLDGSHLSLHEIHRFSNGGVHLGDHLHWDVLRLWSEIRSGLHLAIEQAGRHLKSVGLDTWGVDFGLLDANQNLIGNPYHYRDHHTDGVMEAVFSIVPQEEVYAQTGIQFMQLNSLYQLFSMSQADHPALSVAKTFLNMPDLFNFFLSGAIASEYSIATTTQCYNPVRQAWASDLLTALGISTRIFKDIVPPGTVLGKLHPSLSEGLGSTSISVIAIAGHDTASAVAAVPAVTPDYIYLSSGTWSLMGVELEKPIINSESLRANMTNEGGVDNKTCFLKNIVGLWLVQECRRQWECEGNVYNYEELTRMAGSAPAFSSLIDPCDPSFLSPMNMPLSIQSYCQQTGQMIPSEKGEILRCAFESLALEYRWVAEQIDRLTGKAHPTIHILGGGSQNKLLNQFTANATGRTVIAGPVEATAIGNILVQAIAMGEISSLAEGRELVRNSFAAEIYHPEGGLEWGQAFQRFVQLKGNSGI